MRKINIQGALMRTGGLVAGGIAAGFVTPIVSGYLPGSDANKGTLTNALVMGVGVLAPSFLKTKQNSLLGNVFDGMAAAAGVSLAKAMIPGIGAAGADFYPSYMEPTISGAYDEPTISGNF